MYARATLAAFAAAGGADLKRLGNFTARVEPGGDLWDDLDLSSGADLAVRGLVEPVGQFVPATWGYGCGGQSACGGAPASDASTTVSLHGDADGAELASLTGSADCRDSRTTIMLKHIAREHTEDVVTAALKVRGFAGKYDAVYVPRCRRKEINRGYAFVNFLRPSDAADALGVSFAEALADHSVEAECAAEYASLQGEEFLDRMRSAQMAQDPPRRRSGRSVGVAVGQVAAEDRCGAFLERPAALAPPPGLYSF